MNNLCVNAQLLGWATVMLPVNRCHHRPADREPAAMNDKTSEGEGGTVLPCSLGDDLDSPRRLITRTSPSDTDRTTRRVWCCGTLVSGPHTEGCEFEPRGPLDYDGPVEIREHRRG